MQIVIDIPEEKYQGILNMAEEILDASTFCSPRYLYMAVLNGTPLQSCEDVAKAFQIGVAFGFGKKHDEMDKVIEEIKKVITPQKNCDTCKHKDDGWDSEHCDGCCGNHSGFEPQESEEA